MTNTGILTSCCTVSTAVDAESFELQYWHNRWKNNEIGWHKANVHPFLLQFITETTLNSAIDSVVSESAVLTTGFDKTPTRILVPLCGATIDMLYLASLCGKRIAEVIGIECSEQAAQRFYEEQTSKVVNNNPATKPWKRTTIRFSPGTQNSNFVTDPVDPLSSSYIEHTYYEYNTNAYTTGNVDTDLFLSKVKIFIGDFIDDESLYNAIVTSFGSTPFSLIYDRASLVAINIEDRKRYAERIKKYARFKNNINKTLCFLVAFEYKDGIRNAPPRIIRKNDVYNLYGSGEEVARIRDQEAEKRFKLDVVDEVGWTVWI